MVQPAVMLVLIGRHVRKGLLKVIAWNVLLLASGTLHLINYQIGQATGSDAHLFANMLAAVNLFVLIMQQLTKKTVPSGIHYYNSNFHYNISVHAAVQYKFYMCKENVQKLREASGILFNNLPHPPPPFYFYLLTYNGIMHTILHCKSFSCMSFISFNSFISYQLLLGI